MSELKGVKVSGVRRLKSSRNGNPRYDVVFSDGTVAHTVTDASVNYDVSNQANRPVPLDVQLDARGRIVTWKEST